MKKGGREEEHRERVRDALTVKEKIRGRNV